MKKTALIGLAIAAATQANAELYDFVPDSNYNWNDVGNWKTGGVEFINDTDPGTPGAQVQWGTLGTVDAASLPGSGDTVRVDNNTDATRLRVNTTTTVDTFRMSRALDNNWYRAHAEIQSGAALTVNNAVTFGNTNSHKRESFLTNNGTLNAAEIGSTVNGGWHLDNNGSMNVSGAINMSASRAITFDQNSGSLVVGTLNIGARGNAQTTPVFNMNGGTVTGTTLTSSADGGTLNLIGGAMSFTDTDFFADQTGSGGPFGDFDSIINVTSGSLTIVGQDMEAYFENAIDQGWLTGVDDSQVNFIGGDTVIAVPEPSTYALLAGCLGLTWVMLRRRRS